MSRCSERFPSPLLVLRRPPRPLPGASSGSEARTLADYCQRALVSGASADSPGGAVAMAAAAASVVEAIVGIFPQITHTFTGQGKSGIGVYTQELGIKEVLGMYLTINTIEASKRQADPAGYGRTKTLDEDCLVLVAIFCST
ncbi:Protein of unknown function [Gryllus bimaculatus]|nr:Protein of unknown function [Gryllus bimaculatus]